MTEKQFIDKAIGGGWEDPHKYAEWEIAREKGLTAFLQPKAWEAVGKVEGWVNTVQQATLCDQCGFKGITKKRNYWEYKMHQMIDHLIEGGTINSYLETL